MDFLDRAWIAGCFVVLAFMIIDTQLAIRDMKIESKQIKEYASQAEYNSRFCTYKK